MSEFKLTQTDLQEILIYDQMSGNFIWKVSRQRINKGDVAGSLDSHGYIRIRTGGKNYPAHRLAFLWMTGEIPDYVDHANGDRSDNRWCNLREASLSGNAHNCKIMSNNKSGVKGVYWKKDRQKWLARLQSNGKYIHVGYFPDLIGAELAVRNKRIEIHGEFANHG